MAKVIVELIYEDGSISAVVNDKPVAVDEQAKQLLSKLGFCVSALDGNHLPYSLTAMH